MLTTPVLHAVELTPITLRSLVTLLTPALPQSLPVIGSLLHTPPAADVAVHDAASFAPPNLNAWTSFKLPQDGDLSMHPPPNLFSIVIHSPIDGEQIRFFCSAEVSSEPPSPEEQAHVSKLLTSFLRFMVATAEASATQSNAYKVHQNGMPPAIKLGAIHDKWRSCLERNAYLVAPCVKYLYAPGSTHARSARDDRWIVSRILESDVDTVVATTHVARSREYILARCPTSVCVRDREDGGTRPVGWVLLHSDGSIGTLYVDPEYRRKGLAALLIEEMVAGLGPTAAGSSRVSWYGNAEGGSVLGWIFTDISEVNAAGHRFFGSLKGWKRAWLSHWIFLVTLDTMPATHNSEMN